MKLTNDQIIEGLKDVLKRIGNERQTATEISIAQVIEYGYIQGLLLSGNIKEHAWIQLRQKMGKSILD